MLREARRSFISTEYGNLLVKLESLLENNSGFAVGNKVSIADVYIYQIIDDGFILNYNFKESIEKTIEKVPKLKSCADKVQELAQEYFAARPKTPF